MEQGTYGNLNYTRVQKIIPTITALLANGLISRIRYSKFNGLVEELEEEIGVKGVINLRTISHDIRKMENIKIKAKTDVIIE